MSLIEYNAKSILRIHFVVHYDRSKPCCEIHQADDHQSSGKPTNNNHVVKEAQTNSPVIYEDDEYLYYYVYTPDQPTLLMPR